MYHPRVADETPPLLLLRIRRRSAEAKDPSPSALAPRHNSQKQRARNRTVAFNIVTALQATVVPPAVKMMVVVPR